MWSPMGRFCGPVPSAADKKLYRFLKDLSAVISKVYNENLKTMEDVRTDAHTRQCQDNAVLAIPLFQTPQALRAQSTLPLRCPTVRFARRTCPVVSNPTAPDLRQDARLKWVLINLPGSLGDANANHRAVDWPSSTVERCLTTSSFSSYWTGEPRQSPPLIFRHSISLFLKPAQIGSIFLLPHGEADSGRFALGGGCMSTRAAAPHRFRLIRTLGLQRVNQGSFSKC